MKNIYCIVGPSGCGKTTVVEALQKKYGYKTIESYTTRPPRYEGETGHIFVSPEEFKALGEMVAYTRFDGYEYGVTANLIEKNDLYVIDPAGVEFLQQQYKGAKGVKVFGINADVDVLVERMFGRGDSEDKVVKRLANDAEAFKNLDYVANIILRSDINSVDELCETIQWHIESCEHWSKHEFSLLNEHGEVLESERRFYTYDDAMASLKESYPEGVPEGWTLRDDTEEARKRYIQDIKKLRPSFKSSMILINMDDAGTSRNGYTVVSFKYKEKNYFYRAYHGEAWIEEDKRSAPDRSADKSLNNKIKFLHKRMSKIEAEMLEKQQAGETDAVAQLKTSYERLSKTVFLLEKALDLINRKDLNKPLSEKLTNAVERCQQQCVNSQPEPENVMRNKEVLML